MSLTPTKPRKRLYSEVIPIESSMVDLDTCPRKKVRADDKREFHSTHCVSSSSPVPEIDYSIDEMSISSDIVEHLRPKRKREEFEAAMVSPEPVPKANPTSEGNDHCPRSKKIRYDNSQSSNSTTKLEPAPLSLDGPNGYKKNRIIFNELEERFFVNKYYAEINSHLNRLHFENLEERRIKESHKMVVDKPDGQYAS